MGYGSERVLLAVLVLILVTVFGAEFRQQLIEMGYCNFTAWVLRCIRRQQEEYRHRKSPTGSAKANEGKGRLSTHNIQDCGGNVKLKNEEVVEA